MPSEKLDCPVNFNALPTLASGLLAAAVGLLCLVPPAAWAQVSQGPPRIRNVYIPADQLNLLFDSSAKGVLMPRDKILALWEEGKRREPAAKAPPADAVLSQASYEARVEEHELRLTGRIQIAKLRAGWQTVDLPFGGLAIESAQLDGQPARFGRKDDGTLFVILEKAGSSELVLAMSAPLASKDGDLATTLKLPPLPASEILLRLDQGRQLQVGETVEQAEKMESGRQLFRVAVDRKGLMPLVVSERFAGGKRAPLVLVNSRAVSEIEPAGVRWETTLQLDVYARAADTFRLQLPASLDLAEVESPELSHWTMREEQGGTATVALAFRTPFLGRRAVRLVGLAPVPPAAQWNLPTVKVLEAASHVGQVVVSSSPSLRVEVGELSGLRPERLPRAAAGPRPATAGRSLAFAFWDESFVLPLRVTPQRQALQASVATLVDVSGAGVALRSSLTIEPRYAPLFDVQLRLPRQWEITSLLSANQCVEWEAVPPVDGDPAADAAMQTVRFDLPKPLSPGQSLEVALTAERHPERWLEQDEKLHEVALPELRLAAASEVEGTLRVQAPPDIELLVSNLSDDLQPVAAEGPKDASAQASGTALQYRYQDDARTSGRLQIRTKPAKVSAETLAFVRLNRGKLDVRYQLELHIRQGRIRQVRFTLPVAVGDKIHVTPLDSAVRVLEQHRRALGDVVVPLGRAAGEGLGVRGDSISSVRSDRPTLDLWEIALDQPVTGDLTLAVEFGQTFSAPVAGAKAAAPEDGEVGRAETGTRVPVPVLALQNVSRQSGMVAVEAAADQQIACEPENLRELDPADVLKPRGYVPAHRIVSAYQYQRLPYRLSVSAVRHTPGSVLTAICESADIDSVAGREGRMRHQARFWMRSVSLPHVPVTLPENADLWSVMLDNVPVEVRRSQNTYLVPLPAGSAEAGRELTLVYETEGPSWGAGDSWGRLWPRTVRELAPQIGMEILRTTWHVHAPEEMDVVSSGGDFQAQTPLTRPTLVTRLAETIAQESTRSLAWKFGGLVVAAIVVGFFALIRTSKGFTLVELLVVITIIGILIALLLPATQAARESSRRSQCVNNLKQLGLALHGYHSAHNQFPPAAIGPHNVPRERQFSWLVALLPYLERQDLYEKLRLDLPCDHPHNVAVLKVPLRSLLCPSDLQRPTDGEGPNITSYVAILGTDGRQGGKPMDGIIGFEKGLSIPEIRDGTSNTVIVAEVRDGGPWFAAGEGTARYIEDWMEKERWSEHPGGANMLLADGSVRFFSDKTAVETLRALATPSGGEQLGAFELDAPREKAASGEDGRRVPLPKRPSRPRDATKKEDLNRRLDAARTAPIERPRQPGISRGERARLSLAVALETPERRAIVFRRDGGAGELFLGVQDKAFAEIVPWFLVAAALLAAWMARGVSAARRTMAVMLGLALPIGLSGLVPLAWTPLLDGLLLGVVAASGLWMLLGIIGAIKKSPSGPAVTATAIVVSVLLCADAGMAQENRAAGQPPASTAQAKQPDLTLFIPYDVKKGNPLESTQVYLPHREFLRLWKQAHPDEPSRVPPEVRALVSHVEYSGQLENEVARFDGRLLVHHLADGWTRIALPLGKVALEKIEINGQPATLAGDDPTQPAVYLEKAGQYVVDVRFSVPVGLLGATGQLAVPLRPVSSGRLLFRLPREGLDVQVSGSSGGWRLSPASQGRVAGSQHPGESVSIPLGAVSELSIRWQPRRVESRDGQSISADQALLVEVQDSGIYIHSKFHYRIQQGATRQLPLRIPADMAVQRVVGPEVADWSIEAESTKGAAAGSQRLIVSLKKELTTGTEVFVHGFRRDRTVTGNVAVHALEPLGVVRETGRLAIGCSSQFRVRVDEANGLDQIDRVGLELPQEPGEGCALLSAYRYTARPWGLRLQVDRQRPRVEVSDSTAMAVTARQVTLRSRLTANVSGAPVRSLGLRLPAALRVSQVRVPTGADWFIDRDDKGRQLKVELSEPALGKLEVAVSGAIVRDSHQADCDVLGITVEDAAVQRGQLAIYLDDDLQAVVTNGRGARPIDPGALDTALRPDGNRPVDYAFQYETPPQGLRLRLSAASSRASADVTTVVSVREGAVAYLSSVDFEIRQAGRSRLQVVTPEWLGDDIELRGEQIRQIRSQLSGRGRIWDIELQQPVRGTYRLQLAQTLPLPGDGTVTAAVIRPLDVERSRSHVVLENMTADEIATTTTSGTAPVPITAVPDGLTDSVRRRAVAAYRVNDSSAALGWQRRMREQEAALAASISLADLTTVIHADGRYRTSAAYSIRSSTLQFLELALPPGSQVWSVHVSGQPVHPATIQRQGQSVTLLPLEKTSAGDFSSEVVVLYSGGLGQPLGRWTQVGPPPPQILSQVPVSRTVWTVFLPRQYAGSLVKGESNLEEVAEAYQQEERKLSILDELRQMVQVANVKKGSAAREKALGNLKQASEKLQGYAQQAPQASARNAVDVQEQAQQIAKEIKRLEALKTDGERADGEMTLYFKTPPRDAHGAKAAVERSLERLLESERGEGGRAAPKEGEKKPEQAPSRSEERREGLRKQAAGQLERLQTMQQDEPAKQKKAASQPQAFSLEGRQQAVSQTAGEESAKRPASPEKKASPAAVATGIGQLSLNLDMAREGPSQYFRKLHFSRLHGEPRLVLRAQHESVGRGLVALVWAVLCLAIAVAIIRGLRRSDFGARAYRGWPWLAAVAGTAWLFLLPGGVCGLIVLVIALCTLIVRVSQPASSGR